MREATELPTKAPVRLSVNLSRKAAEALKSITERREITLTEAVRRAISTQLWVEDTLDRGAKILVVEPGDGPVHEMNFIR